MYLRNMDQKKSEYEGRKHKKAYQGKGRGSDTNKNVRILYMFNEHLVYCTISYNFSGSQF